MATRKPSGALAGAMSVFFLALCACPPPPCGVGPGGPRGLPPAGTSDAGLVGLDGPVVVVELGLPLTFRCNGAVAEPPRVTGSVLDPFNREIEPQVVVTSRPSSGGYLATVTFASNGPGWYHLSVGNDELVSQEDLLLLHDGSAQPPLAQLPHDCQGALQRTAAGEYVCAEQWFHGAAAPTSFPDSGLYVGAEALWQTLDGKLRLATASGAEAALELPTDQGLGQGLATGADFVLVGLEPSVQPWLQQVLLSPDGGLTKEPPVSFSTPPPAFDKLFDPVGLFALRTAQAVFIISSRRAGDDGGFRSAPLEFDAEVCRVPLDGGRAIAPDGGCSRLRGQPIGVERDGVWLLDDTTLRFYAPSGPVERLGLVASASLPPFSLLEPRSGAVSRSPYLPHLPTFALRSPDGRSFTAVPQHLDGGIAFTAFPFRTLTAATDFAWAPAPDGGTLVFGR